MKMLKNIINIILGRKPIGKPAEPKKPVVNNAKEEELLKRIRTYEPPAYIKKTQITKQTRNRHVTGVKTTGKNPVTDKQETFIKVIEITVNKYYGYQKIHFTGATKQEAMCWIDKHIKEFRRIENTCVAGAARKSNRIAR